MSDSMASTSPFIPVTDAPKACTIQSLPAEFDDVVPGSGSHGALDARESGEGENPRIPKLFP